MNNDYKVGKVYIWQNQVGAFAYLNGKETTVVGPKELAFHSGTFRLVEFWPTDTPCNCDVPEPHTLAAFRGDLRPKDPPSGEQKVMSWFKTKPVLEPA